MDVTRARERLELAASERQQGAPRKPGPAGLITCPAPRIDAQPHGTPLSLSLSEQQRHLRERDHHAGAALRAAASRGANARGFWFCFRSLARTRVPRLTTTPLIISGGRLVLCICID